jgi:hypothetical protein
VEDRFELETRKLASSSSRHANSNHLNSLCFSHGEIFYFKYLRSTDSFSEDAEWMLREVIVISCFSFWLNPFEILGEALEGNLKNWDASSVKRAGSVVNHTSFTSANSELQFLAS